MAMPGDVLNKDPNSSDYGYPLPGEKLPSNPPGALPTAPPNSLAPSLAPSPAVSGPPSPNLSASSPVPIPSANAAESSMPIPSANAAESSNHGQPLGQTLQVPGASSGTAADSLSTAPETVFTAVINLTLAPDNPSSSSSVFPNNNSGVMTPVGGSNTVTATATTTQNPQHHTTWSFSNVPSQDP